MKKRAFRLIVRLGCRLTALAVLTSVMGFASVAGAVYYPPASRSVTWQGNVGVSGDIPNRTVIYKTLSPSGADDTSAIQTAINNCPAGQVVLLSSGTFNITKIDMKSNVTLRGAGLGVTTLKGTSTSTSYIVSFSNGGGGLGTSYNLAGGYTKGSTSITTATTTNWQPGDIILFDQLQNPSGDPVINNTGLDGTCTWCGRSSGTRPIGQIVKLTSVSGTTVVPEMPLYWSFDSNFAPQGTKINIGIHDAGVENLTIDNSTSMNANQSNDGTVYFGGAANCWLLKADVYGVWRVGILLEKAYRNTIRSSRVHYSYAHGANAGYALWMLSAASANLVEDSIFDDLTTGPIFNGATSGNVLAYNYITNMYDSSTPGRVLPGLTNHGAHPIMNLWEGNYLDGVYVESDQTWGSASHGMVFRNRVFYKTSYTSQRFDVGLFNMQTYFNVVGNVLGTKGYETRYQYSSIPYSGDAATVYVMGGYGSYGLETSSLIRHGNWDCVNSSVAWDPTISDHTLPSSLYLAAQPSWWTNMAWPPIDPTKTTPTDCSIPARQRYLLGNPPVQGAPVAK